MRKLVALTAMIPLMACGGSIGDFSHAGLSYSLDTDMFSGMPLTAPSALPATGTAVYTGVYRGGSFQNLFAGGSAAMDVNFSAGTAALTLAGDFVGTSIGRISGTTVSSTRFSKFQFDGNFYGDTGNVIAGDFAGLTNASDPTSVASGEYIVSR